MTRVTSRRGFACIGLYRPKTPENIGGVLRAAGCYECAQVNIEGARPHSLRHGTNTQRTELTIPVFIVDDVMNYVPENTSLVAVDLVEGARPLPTFVHPERALYLFGPEDGTLGPRHTDKADHVVYIPTRHCMNLAACVNVVLYDRFCKGAR